MACSRSKSVIFNIICVHFSAFDFFFVLVCACKMFMSNGKYYFTFTKICTLKCLRTATSTNRKCVGKVCVMCKADISSVRMTYIKVLMFVGITHPLNVREPIKLLGFKQIQPQTHLFYFTYSYMKSEICIVQ